MVSKSSKLIVLWNKQTEIVYGFIYQVAGKADIQYRLANRDHGRMSILLLLLNSRSTTFTTEEIFAATAQTGKNWVILNAVTPLTKRLDCFKILVSGRQYRLEVDEVEFQEHHQKRTAA